MWSPRSPFIVGVLSLALIVVSTSAQVRTDAPALLEMVETERAFAMRATVVGWKQAFLEFFSDTAVGFSGDAPGSAKEQIRQAPDPPKELQLLWEPRYGDIADSEELGFLTGPSTTINPARNGGTPRYGNYATIWKREADGRFRVVIDVGISIPREASFAPGFSRAPREPRSATLGTLEAATQMLRDADAALATATSANQATGYSGRLARGVRFHRPGIMPMVGEVAVLRWLRTQRAYAASESRFAEVSRARDLAYTWGTYNTRATGSTGPERGYYVRVWSRAVNGAWRVALDVLQ